MTLEALIAAIIAMSFNLPPEQARIHVEAATAAAAEYELPVELLLGVAYVESRFDERALSRLECASKDLTSCVRKTGVWPYATKPPKAQPSWYCGPLQSGGYVSWAECQKMRTDVAYGYRMGAQELVTWLNDKRCHSLGADDRLRCALAGHNAGNAGVAAYRTVKYVDWVLLARDRVVKFADYAERKAQRPGS
jgi:soluble lytic murein transglycosylase-like protein